MTLQYSFIRFRTGQTRTVLSRCISSESSHSHYQVIPGFLEFLHYAVEDIKNSLAAGGSIFSVLFIGCITMNFVFLLYPKQAMFLCFATSLFITVSATVYAVLSILHSTPDFDNDWSKYTMSFILDSALSKYCFVGFLSAFGLAFNLIGITWTMKCRKQVLGLWEISSKLIKCSPQLLSQPVLSLFVIAITTAYFLVIMLLLLGCKTIKVSPLEDTVNLEQSDFTWLLLPETLTFIWFIDLIEKGQSAILAGAASQWYFTRRFNLTFYPMSAVLKYNLGAMAAITVSNIFSRCKNSCPAHQAYISNYATISLGVYGNIRESFLDQNRAEKYSTHLTKACIAIHFALLAWKIGLIEISTLAFLTFTSQISMFTSLIPTILNAFTSWKVVSLFISGLESIILGLAVSAHEDCLRNERADPPNFCDSVVTSLLLGNKSSLDEVSSKSSNSSDSFKSVHTFSTQNTPGLSKTGSSSVNYTTASSSVFKAATNSRSNVTSIEYRYESTKRKDQRADVGSDEEYKSPSSPNDDKRVKGKIVNTVKRDSSVDSWGMDSW